MWAGFPSAAGHAGCRLACRGGNPTPHLGIGGQWDNERSNALMAGAGTVVDRVDLMAHDLQQQAQPYWPNPGYHPLPGREGPLTALLPVRPYLSSSARTGILTPPATGAETQQTRCLGGPALCASTVPPCISTKLFTSVRPIPKPLLAWSRCLSIFVNLVRLKENAILRALRFSAQLLPSFSPSRWVSLKSRSCPIKLADSPAAFYAECS